VSVTGPTDGYRGSGGGNGNEVETANFNRQGTTKKGNVRFNAVAPTEYTVQVIAPGFGRVAKNIDVQDHGTLN